MHDAQAVAVVIVPSKFFLLIWAAAGVLGLDETDVARFPAEDLLHEQFTHIRAAVEVQQRVLSLQRGQDKIVNDAVGRGNQMQPADAAEVRLDITERRLPHRADKIDHRIEPAEDGVVLTLCRAPAIP